MKGKAMKQPTEAEMLLAVADIAGFAKACRGKSDRETFDMLDRFYELVGKSVNELFLMPWDGPELSADLRRVVGEQPGDI